MSHPEHDPNEAELASLFDSTAEAPSATEFTRLRARAADVPARAQRRPAWFPRWAWAPSFAALAVLAGVFVAGLQGGPNGALMPSASAPLAVQTQPAASATAAEPAPVTEQAALDPNADLSGSGFALGEEGDGLGMDSLEGPSSSDDVDAWMYATAALLEGG